MNVRTQETFQRVRDALPPKIVLHIGMTKAGSTAIQNTFEKNYDLLLKRGVLFPRSVFTRPNPYARERTPGHLQLVRDLVRGNIENFEKEILSTTSNANTLVFSAENIFLDIEQDGINALAELFAGKSINLVCIVREQISWCASRYYESVVKGNLKETRPFDDYISGLISDGQLDYNSRINEISSALGAQSVTVADYDAIKRDIGVVPWFTQTMGLEEMISLEGEDQFSNVSKPFPEAIEARRKINALIDFFSTDQRFAWLSQMDEMAAEICSRHGIKSTHITPTFEQRQRILNACKESNDKLSESFLDGASFGPRTEALGKPEAEPLNEAVVYELLSAGIELLSTPAKTQIREQKKQKKALAETKNKLKQRQQAEIQLEAKLAARDAALALREMEAQREAARADAANTERSEAEKRARRDARKLADLQIQFSTQQTTLTLREKEAQREANRADAASAERAEAEERSRKAVEKTANIKRDLQRTLKEHSAVKKKLAKAEAMAAQREQECNEARSQAVTLDRELKSLRNSASWRATAPLRLFSNTFGIRKLRAEMSALRSTGLGPIGAWRYRRNMKDTQRILTGSPFFDTSWYLSEYPDVAANGWDPVEHYLQHGAKEGRDPGPEFKTTWYIKTNPDVAAGSINPLHHYIVHGQKEGRVPTGNIEEKSPQNIPDTLSAHDKKRINAFFDKAKGGFMSAGIRDLEALITAKRSKKSVRQAASFRLATLLADSSSKTDVHKASTLLSKLNPRKIPGGTQSGWFVLKLTALLNIGAIDEAQELVEKAKRLPALHPDILLIGSTVAAEAAHAQSTQDISDKKQIALIANAFQKSAGIGFTKADQARPLSFENLSAPTVEAITEGPLVSVIMPAYNCASYIETSIRSILNQSWKNLELIICDDASTDGTPEILTALESEDPRIRIILRDENSGAYTARNHALSAARGQFVTCQDADDWSHPERIRRQVEALISKPNVIANASHWARADDQLRFIRAPLTARVVHFNSSSIMFRREPVIEKVGYWDSVRFGADTEFWHRLRITFGEDAVTELPELLAIARVRTDSLTRSLGSEYTGAKIGARKAYFHGYSTWHEQNRDNLKISFPSQKRPFGVPLKMTPERPKTEEYDVIIISDFRHLGGNTASNVQEMQAQARAGLKTGIVQVDRYDFATTRPIHSDVQALVDSGDVDILVHGDDVKAHLVTVRFPAIFSELQDFLPKITTNNVRVIVNQPPRRVRGEPPFYSVDTCKKHIKQYLGHEGIWVPIGPAVRDAFAADNESYHLSDDDWFNIIDVDAWHVPRAEWQDNVPVIGRHGRDNFEKWPTRAQDIISAYPDDGSIKVRVLGGASVPTQIIGQQPRTWEVLQFNEIPPREFLAGLDFFVFFPHEERIEAFGRTIIEAMASGCLVILPRDFEALFGDAAIYSTPSEVRGVIEGLYTNRAAYEQHVSHAEKVVRENFGFEQHINRVRRITGA